MGLNIDTDEMQNSIDTMSTSLKNAESAIDSYPARISSLSEDTTCRNSVEEKLLKIKNTYNNIVPTIETMMKSVTEVKEAYIQSNTAIENIEVS